MKTRLNLRISRGRGMRTNLGCRATRMSVAPRILGEQRDNELAHRLAADEPIMAAATDGERRVFTIFKWSMIALLGLIVLTLFVPAVVLLDLMLLCVVAVYGSRWRNTRDAIAARIERASRQADALSRNRIIAHQRGTLDLTDL